MRVLLVVLLCLALQACGQRDAAEPRYVGTDISGADIGSRLVLTDHRGAVRRLGDYRGKVVALFFGYTHCPDVCPTTMDDLAKALKLLGERKREVQVLFVTLDPERDSREVLAQYVPAFDAGFVGLYGDAAATERVAKDFKLFYKKQPAGGKAGYIMDHSAGIYVFDKKGAIRLYLNHGQKPQDIAHDLRQLMGSGAG